MLGKGSPDLRIVAICRRRIELDQTLAHHEHEKARKLDLMPAVDRGPSSAL